MALVDSLLSAMVRADGDALVMHVGERPIVVSGSRTVDLSNHGMNLGAMVGMLSQLLSLDAQAVLRELGAVEHELPSRESDRFSVVAARSGDDIWIEIRRRREALTAAATEAPVALPPPAEGEAEVAAEAAQAVPETASGEEREAPGADAGAEPESVATASSDPTQDEPAEVAAQDVDPPADPELTVIAEDDGGDAIAAQVDGAQAAADSGDAESGVTEVERYVVTELPQVTDTDDPPVEAVAQDDGDGQRDEALGQAGDRPPDQTPVEDTSRAESVTEAMPLEVAEAVAANSQDLPADEVADPVVAVASPPEEVADEVEASTEPQAVPAFASAATTQYPAFTLVSGTSSMDAAHHQGHSAGEPPLESAAPVSSEHPLPSAPTDASVGLSAAPVTRTVRIEVPARSNSARASGIDRLLRAADAAGASELFLVSQSRPYVRVGGNVRPLPDEPVLVGSDIETLIADITPEPWRDAVRRGDPADWLIELPEVGRVRCASFRDHRGPGANFHFAFLRAATADELQLNAETRRLATEPDGLVLVSGAAGSEISAIVAAFVDLLNQQRADYIITLEPQVRNLHANREALISQREVGTDAARSAATALAALREQPDVLVIESLASGELAQLAIDAAAQHRLVIVSIEAASAPAAVQRLVELVPAEHRSHARQQLSRCFRGAVAQLMLRKSAGGKIAARELLTSTSAVTRLLADGELSRLADQLETAGATGLAPIADTVVDYVRSGLVDVREAVRKAPDASRLVDQLRTAGADLSALDGWN